MDSEQLRGWLLCQPKPHTVRITSAGKAPQTLSTAGASWRELAQSVCAIGAELVEALDEKGNCTRAVRADELAAEPAADEPSPEEQTANALMAADPENARLIIFARLVADAYRHSTEVAFERLTSLFDTMVRRTESLERSLASAERLAQRAAIEAAENAGAGETGSFEQQMMAAFLQGQARKAASETNGKTEVK